MRPPRSQYGKDGTNAGPLETLLKRILLRLVETAVKARADRRRWEEQERLRREQAERGRAERARVEKLLADAEAWRREDDLRAYIAAVEERAAGRGQPTDTSPELAGWLSWAREQADRFAPVPDSRHRLLGDPQS